MKPLLYLFSRSFINGTIRAFKSPWRAIAWLFFAGYYGWLLVRGALSVFQAAKLLPDMPITSFEVVASIVFILFFVVAQIGISSLFVPPIGFQRADTDVLFATPVKYRDILSYQFLRSFAFRIVLPLLLWFFGMAPLLSFGKTITHNQVSLQSMTAVVRIGIVAYYLLSLTFFAARYALVLATSGTESRRESLRKWGARLTWWTTVALFGIVGSSIYFELHAYPDRGILPAIMIVASNKLFWVLSPFAGISTFATLGPLHSPIDTVIGMIGLVGLSALSLLYCYRHANRLCEFSHQSLNILDLKTKGRSRGLLGSYASRAERGKLKAANVAWISQLNARGETAFIWREAIYTWRTGLPIFTIVLLSTSFITIITRNQSFSEMNPILVGILAMMSVSIGMATSTAGTQDFLKKTDLVRVLPLSWNKLMHYETFSRAGIMTMAIVPAILIWCVTEPVATGSALLVFSMLGVMNYEQCAVGLLMNINLPDSDDPTQKQFRDFLRGIISMILLVLSIAIFAGSYVLCHVVGTIGVAPGIAISALSVLTTGAGISWVLILLCSRAYLALNPGE